MTPDRFRTLLHELVDENPFAIRPFLKILDIRFTDRIPTLAVTCTDAPELLVNLAFLDEHCRGDVEVKAVILHEFLHVLLSHTEERDPASPAEHLAMDAVINALIHRQEGAAASGMMSRYYREAEGVLRILRPPRPGELPPKECDWKTFDRAWAGLYSGSLMVDDIRELATQLEPALKRVGGFILIRGSGLPGQSVLLGNHDDFPGSVPGRLSEALDAALRTMNGGGIWRSPWTRGVGADPYGTLVQMKDPGLLAWEARALKVLRNHLLPDTRSKASRFSQRDARLPVLSPKDRRAFIRASWSPFFPEAAWSAEHREPSGRAQVYLDVSGSMNAEMPLVIGLLNRLRSSIRMPFWAFSDRVVPATIRDGALQTETTGGTSMACVLDHIARTSPECAVVVTDGYIETLPANALERTRNTRIHVLVTRDGSASQLQRAGLACTQLQKLPPPQKVSL